jgi:hypothetical protein
MNKAGCAVVNGIFVVGALYLLPCRSRRSVSLRIWLELISIRDRSFENQRHRASGLNLLVAAITLWNTVISNGP